ncbi:GIY-YIG-domain-containing protein, partial [Morchella conica CCBAS932]
LQKESILTENKGKSGVYRWTNKENGKSYVGSAVDLGRRFSEYYSKKFLVKSLTFSHPHKRGALLKNDYLKFQLEILVYCEAEDAVNLEQKFIDLLKPEYNLCKIAGSSLGPFQSESKESMEIRASRARSAREAASPTAIAIEVTDLVSGVTTIFASARRAGEFLNASNSTIMNKIKGKNNKPYKERFIIKLHRG